MKASLSKCIYLFIFWLRWVFIAVLAGFLLLQRAGATLCCGAWALGMWALVVVARGLSSCGAWA